MSDETQSSPPAGGLSDPPGGTDRPEQPERKSPPPPPPAWTHFVWIVGLVLTALILFLPSPPTGPTLTFTEWTAKVDAGAVKTAAIDANGKVTGELADGKAYTRSERPRSSSSTRSTPSASGAVAPSFRTTSGSKR